MKKEILSKKIIFLNLFIFLFFAFSFNLVQASQNIPDICGSGIEEKFQFLCEKDQLPDLRELFGFEEKSDNKAKKESFGAMAVSSIESESDDSDEIIIGGNEEWNENKSFDHKIITIESGAQLEIKAGVTITLKDSIINVEGKFITSGTKEKPVIIKSSGEESDSGFSIISDLDDEDGQINEILMKNTDISGNNNVLGAVITKKTKLNMEECSIHDNVIGIVMAENDSNEKKVNRSKFYGNQIDAVSYYELGGETLAPDFRYNWWGENTSKIVQYCSEEYGCIAYHDKLFGLINIKPWFVSEDFFDPVVIIPGITGSQKDVLGWHLDPIMHTYDNLVASFEENGYEKGKNLFEFPYEWRSSNVETAQKLKEKINEIKEKTGLPAVDIVAHSMGGLVARQYIESDDYENDINQLITLGTPHKGAPEAYLKWEAGEGFEDAFDKIAKKMFQLEALHSGYLDLGKYIREEVESVRQLLPDYSYLKEASSGEMRNYPDNYPGNMFLETLNAEDNANELNNVDFINIVGNLTGVEKTISGFRLVDSSEEDSWQHGIPENFYDSSTDRGIEYGAGDQTVPLKSSTGIDIGEKIEINSIHGDLPTKVQCDAIKKLIGKEECEYVSTFDRTVDIITFGVFSPVDIQVITPDGWAGKNILGKPESEVLPGAFYTGSETENEFLTIPIFGSDEKDFKIITQGTGEGEYKIEIARITENEDANEAREITATISGTATPNQEESKNLRITEDEIIVGSDKIPPEISIISPEENKAYLNTGTVPIIYEISDNKSPRDKIEKEIYLDENKLQSENIDLAFLNLGEHRIRIIAKDEAGNIGQKEVSFKTKTSVDAMIDNLAYYHKLKMIEKQDKVVLTANIEIIKQLQEMMVLLEKNKFIKNRTKEMLIVNLEKQINFHLDWLSFYVEVRSDPNLRNNIDPEAGKLLIEDFNFLKYNF